MADERALLPNVFAGKVDDDAGEWIRHFDKYCVYRNNNEQKSLALFKVLLTGTAAVWLESLPATSTDTMEHLKEAFQDRFLSPQILKYKSAKEIFSRRQGPTETVDEFYVGVRKLARTINASDDMVIYALLSGFRGPIANYVTQNRPETIEQVLEFARMAELTIPLSSSADNQLADQLNNVKSEMREFAAKLDRMTNTAVYTKGAQCPVGEQRSFPPRRVPLATDAPHIPSQRSSNNSSWQRSDAAQYNGNRGFWPRNNFTQKLAQMSSRGINGDQQQQKFSACGRCGEQQHSDGSQCPARNRTCRLCFGRNHLAKACRTAGYGRAATQRRPIEGPSQ